MKRNIIVCFFILGFTFSVNSQINKNGIPFITNYSQEVYGANSQNWSIVTDNRGVLYVGNNDCILIYDGINWRTVYVDNNSIIRSLSADKNGNIYVGAVSEFGYLYVNEIGNEVYQSLMPKIDSIDRNFVEVWKTYSCDIGTYFCAYNKIFFLDKQHNIKVIPLNDEYKFSFFADNDLFVEHFTKGLKKYTNDTLFLLKNGEYFADKDIFFLDNFGADQLLIGTIVNGLSLYNLATNELNCSYIPQKTNQLLSKNYLYNGAQVNKNIFGFATLQNGAVFINQKGEIQYHIKPSDGLADPTVTYMYSDNDKSRVVWLGLNSGLSKSELNIPYRYFGEEHGLKGAINDIIRNNNILYVGTDIGVYFLDFSDEYPIFKMVENLNAQIWSLINFKTGDETKLLCGTSIGIFEIIDGKAIQIKFVNSDNSNYYTFALYQIENELNSLLVGYNKGIFAAKYANGKWTRKIQVPDFKESVKHILKHNNTIWLSTILYGIYKIDSNKNIIKYQKDKGLQSLLDIFLFNYKNNIYCSNIDGLFRYDAVKDIFVKDSLLGNDYYNGNTGAYKIVDDKKQFFVSAFNKSDKWIEQIVIDNEGKPHQLSSPFKRLPSEQIFAIYPENDLVWFGSSVGLFSYNLKMDFEFDRPYNALIRKVVLNEDSVLFWGNYVQVKDSLNYSKILQQPQSMINEIDYSLNHIRFEYSSPFFEAENKILFSYKLEGFKDAWSHWSSEPKTVFTNLSEGKYTFRVKAKNIYNVESNVAGYSFQISPPWYRTIVMYIVYGLIGIVVIVIIVKLYTRKLELEKIHLEGIVKERTVEIREQNKELEHKNDEITQQHAQISKQKEEITSSIRYAKRIQKAVVPSKERADELLKDYFLLWRPRDIVSGDFWWMKEIGGKVVVAAADCTGHGVPGAFMSMLGVSFLNEITGKAKEAHANLILNELRTSVKTTLKQTGKEGEAKDGMDIALLVIDFEKMILQFAGAYNPLYLFRNGELLETKGDRNPIGIYVKEKDSFTNNIIELEKGDTLYIFSDGYVDQFGGEKKMKYKSKKFKQLLLDIQDKTMEEQKDILNYETDEWRGSIEQIDDIIILGIRV